MFPSHDHTDYLLGYCCKEGDIASTSYTKEELQAKLEYFINFRKNTEKVHNSGKWVCKGINSLLPTVYNWAKEERVLYYQMAGTQKRSIVRLKALVALMLGYDLLPFSMVRKISNKDQDYWETYVRIKEDDSFDMIKHLSNYDFDD